MPWIWAIALLVASYFISASMMKKPVAPKPAALDEFDFPQADDGTPQIVVFGDVWIEDWTVLWYGNYRTEEIESDEDKK